MSERAWAAFGRLFFFILVTSIVLIAAALVIVLRHGVSARSAPTRTEELVARTARHFAVPLSARRMSNPLAKTAENLRAGREHFADHCAVCHANDGSGKTEMGESLYPKAPDMRGPQTQQLSDGEIFYIIRNGVRLTGMPAWGSDQDAAENWKLVHFIRHLPAITAAEMEEMRMMNPISRHEFLEEQAEDEFLEGANKDANP